jgi:transposase
MDEIVKMLDKNLDYINHEIVSDVYYIKVKSNRDKVICPFCNAVSNNPHSFYKRTFQDLPIQGKKVIIQLKNRKMYCKNSDCSHTTFAERFDFINNNARKSERTKEEIMDVSLNCSSVAASQLLKKVSIDVGKSTICNMIKKKKLMSKRKM